MARLIWKDPGGTTRTVSLSATAVLGRDEQAECQLCYQGVSRRHALIQWAGEEGYYLEDLESTNGVLLNGTRVEKKVRLQSGDRIQLGTVLLEFDAELSGPETRSTESTEPLSRALKYEKALASLGQLPPAGVSGQLPEVLPRKAGKFYLLEKLGQGGMGSVYRARDRESGREVAVKFIRSNIGRREAFIEFFHNREAVLAREIDHPNVIRVYEHGVRDDQHYISMEYVRGENLYRVMKRRTLSPGEVLEILRQVACGLAAAHRQGVVHSDVKPANILLVEGFCSSSTDEEDEGGILPEDDIPDGILEFDGDAAEEEMQVSTREGLDPELLIEIRRRIGDKPSVDILDDPPYFNRPSEMRYIEHYLERMEEGRGFFVVVEGEAGVGKKRLISEFLIKQQAAARSLPEERQPQFFELDCSRIEGIPRLYEQMVSRKPGPDFNLRQIVEEIKQLTETSGRPTVIRVLELGDASPLACLLIVHWLSLMEKQPILLIASLGLQEERDNSSVKLLLESAHAVLKELYLRPVTEYQIQRYLEILFVKSYVGPDLGGDLFRLSGGNFARILDLLRSFYERGILRADPATGVIEYRPSSREFELEEGKNLYEKYRAYGKLEQRILQYAAFIGERFFFDVLLRYCHVEETTLFFLVRQILADGFLTEDSRTWYRFVNAAFQRYMAERIPPSERPHLHRKLSRLLESVPVPESPELFQLRARHFAGCREYGKAVQSLLDGAHLARNDYRLHLAREMYQEILRIYRQLARSEAPRKEVTGVLKEWYRRDGNWYEILGELGMREEKACVKIADFGISFRTADEERGYQVGKLPAMGTPRYVAPERGQGEYGGLPSDVFSLGIIAYEMIVGEPPYPGVKGREVVQAYRHRPTVLPAEHLRRFPQGFGALVSGMLAIDPSRRWDAERVIREIVKLQFDLQASHGAASDGHG